MFPQQHQPLPASAGIAPVSFWEWFCKVYPAEEYIYNWQHYFVTILATAATANQTGNLNIQTPLFCFAFRSFAWVTATGAAPTFPIRVGISLASGNDWTFGQWASQVITGNGGTPDLPFPWPRELPASTQLTINVNNAVPNSNQAVTVDAGIVGLEPRARAIPLTHNTRQQMFQPR